MHHLIKLDGTILTHRGRPLFKIDDVYCAGTGAKDGLATIKTWTVQPTVTAIEDGVIGHVHIMPTGSARRHIYLNFSAFKYSPGYRKFHKDSLAHPQFVRTLATELNFEMI